MRVIFIGASTLARATTRLMAEAGHEVVIVEKDQEVVEMYADELDCSFLQGDGSRPGVLQELDPGSTDCLYCLSNDDTANILAAVVAKKMDFEKIVVRIEDEDLLAVCEELEIEHVIVPNLKLARDLIDFGEGDAQALSDSKETSTDA